MQATPKVVGALCLCFCSLSLPGQTGFGNIRVGEPVASLPFPCTDVASCEGEYQSSWVRVSFVNGNISNFHVIYSGKTLLGDPIEMTPITLAQSVRLHSLQEGLKEPFFGLAQGRNGAVYGVADLQNQIVYITGSASPSSPVKEVVYVRPDAPVMDAASRSRLPDGGNALIEAARSSVPYTNLAKKPHIKGIDDSGPGKGGSRTGMQPEFRELNGWESGGGRRTSTIRAASFSGPRQRVR